MTSNKVKIHNISLDHSWYSPIGLWTYTHQASTALWRDQKSLQWCHNERDGVSNHQPHDCLLNGLCRRRSKKTSKLRVTGLCENSPVTGEFPAQRASNSENGLCEGNSPVTGEFPAQRASNSENGFCEGNSPVTGEFPAQRDSNSENGLCQGNSPVNSPHKGPVTRKMFPFDDGIVYMTSHQ